MKRIGIAKCFEKGTFKSCLKATIASLVAIFALQSTIRLIIEVPYFVCNCILHHFMIVLIIGRVRAISMRVRRILRIQRFNHLRILAISADWSILTMFFVPIVPSWSRNSTIIFCSIAHALIIYIISLVCQRRNGCARIRHLLKSTQKNLSTSFLEASCALACIRDFLVVACLLSLQMSYRSDSSRPLLS